MPGPREGGGELLGCKNCDCGAAVLVGKEGLYVMRERSAFGKKSVLILLGIMPVVPYLGQS